MQHRRVAASVSTCLLLLVLFALCANAVVHWNGLDIDTSSAKHWRVALKEEQNSSVAAAVHARFSPASSPFPTSYPFLAAFNEAASPELRSEIYAFLSQHAEAASIDIHYVPSNSYLVFAPVNAVAALEKRFAKRLQTVMLVQSHMKLHDQLRNVYAEQDSASPSSSSSSRFATASSSSPQPLGVNPALRDVLVEFAASSDAEQGDGADAWDFAQSLAAFAEENGLVVRGAQILDAITVMVSFDEPEHVVLAAELFAAVPRVVFVQVVTPRRVFNNRARWNAQTNVANSEPYTNILTGQGVIVGVGDTGLDRNSCFFYDATGTFTTGKPTPTCNVSADPPTCTFSAITSAFVGTSSHRKIAGYYSFKDAGENEDNGHGTHVAGSVLGNADPSGTTLATYNGNAKLAKVFLYDIGSPTEQYLSLPSDIYGGFFGVIKAAGAVISTNSWGSGVSSYSWFSRRIDQFAHFNRDFLILFAAGNEGSGGNTLSQESRAKNIVCVGASVSGSGTTPSNSLASFSSRGPADSSGRFGISIALPGNPLSSAKSLTNQPACGTDLRASLTTVSSHVVGMSGTSMATPNAAGIAAQLFQYYREFYPNSPGDASGTHPFATRTIPASLIRATLINAAQPLSLENNNDANKDEESVKYGFGKPVLNNIMRVSSQTTASTPKTIVLSAEDHNLSNGGVVDFQFTVTSATNSGSVSLLWVDAPGTTSAVGTLINNLDLQLRTGTGSSVLTQGNVDYVSGVTSSSPDTKNPAERINFSNLRTGRTYRLRVSASLPSGGTQNFSLVLSGVNISTTSLPTCTSNCNDRGTCTVTNGVSSCVCDPGFSGTLCESGSATCPGNCNGNGTCNTSTGICSCTGNFDPATSCSSCLSGFFGPTCGCSASTTCNNRGTCTTAGTCQCNSGWTGSDCLTTTATVSVSPTVVAPGGTITATYAGFPGATQYDELALVPTSNAIGNDGSNWKWLYGSKSGSVVFTMPTTATGTYEVRGFYDFPGSYYGNFLTKSQVITVQTTVSCPNNCSGNGTCNTTTGVCTCNGNFGGTDCSNCKAGFAGASCGIQCPACQNGGTCSEGTTGTGQCVCTGNFDPANNCSNCRTGFAGATCSIQCPSCQNGGSCSSGITGTGQCICTGNFDPAKNCGDCRSGFAGATCSIQCPTCQGFATCSQGITGTGQCVCPANFDPASNCSNCLPGFAGPTCSIQCPTCLNGGTCSSGLTGTGQCVCTGNFGGSTCSQCTGNFDLSKNCADCKPGFAGASCSIQCPSCQNGGSCNQGIGGTGACVCTGGFTGTDCSIPPQPVSCPNNCYRRGTCNNGVCSCFNGFSGADCGTSTATLSVSALQVAPNSPIAVMFSGFPGITEHDELALVPITNAPGTDGSLYRFLNKRTAGTHVFTAPATVGSYEVRGYYNYTVAADFTNDMLLLKSPTIVVSTCVPETSCNNHGTCTATSTCSCFAGFFGSSCAFSIGTFSPSGSIPRATTRSFSITGTSLVTADSVILTTNASCATSTASSTGVSLTKVSVSKGSVHNVNVRVTNAGTYRWCYKFNSLSAFIDAGTLVVV